MIDQKLHPPIMLLGNVRSGTSMVQSFFGLVDGVSTWFEPRTVWAYGAPGRRHDRFDASDATPKVKRYIRKRMLGYQAEHGGRVMEKTPSNILRAQYVHEIFPESKLIYIIRHPLAQLSSSEFRWQNVLNTGRMLDRIKETPNTQLHYYGLRLLHDNFRKRVLRKKHVSIWGVRYPGVYQDKKVMSIEQLIAKQWAEGSRVCRADLDEIDRVCPGTTYRVRYEDFVERPAEHFLAMCEHVGLDVTQSVLDEVAERADSSSKSKWKRLDPGVIESIRPIVEEEMLVNGYEFPTDMPTEEERQEVLGLSDLSKGGQGSTRAREDG